MRARCWSDGHHHTNSNMLRMAEQQGRFSMTPLNCFHHPRPLPTSILSFLLYNISYSLLLLPQASVCGSLCLESPCPRPRLLHGALPHPLGPLLSYHLTEASQPTHVKACPCHNAPHSSSLLRVLSAALTAIWRIICDVYYLSPLLKHNFLRAGDFFYTPGV